MKGFLSRSLFTRLVATTNPRFLLFTDYEFVLKFSLPDWVERSETQR